MSASYVYFALKGDDFDPDEVTKQLAILPTEAKRKGEAGRYIPKLRQSFWKYSSDQVENALDIDALVEQVLQKLRGKEQAILSLKKRLNLTSVLQIVLWIDTNQEVSSPFLGHDISTIRFLHETATTTDLDIYRYDSSE